MECCTSTKDMKGTGSIASGSVALGVPSPFGDVLCVPVDVHSVNTTRTLRSGTSLKVCIKLQAHLRSDLSEFKA